MPLGVAIAEFDERFTHLDPMLWTAPHLPLWSPRSAPTGDECDGKCTVVSRECAHCGACEPVCPVEAIYYEDDVPDQWGSYTQINADFFAELGSPGGASKVGLTDNDPQVIKDLPPQGED